MIFFFIALVFAGKAYGEDKPKPPWMIFSQEESKTKNRINLSHKQVTKGRERHSKIGSLLARQYLLIRQGCEEPIWQSPSRSFCYLFAYGLIKNQGTFIYGSNSY